MEEPFYTSGLLFSCRKCSSCCRHSPGYVFLSREDVVRLAKAFRTSPEIFVDIYCRTVDVGGFYRLSLNEQQNYDCIFWENGGCSVYEFRPFQCSSFPFWSSNLDSRESWHELTASCPGVNQGREFSREEIDEFLSRRLIEPLL